MGVDEGFITRYLTFYFNLFFNLLACKDNLKILINEFKKKFHDVSPAGIIERASRIKRIFAGRIVKVFKNK